MKVPDECRTCEHVKDKWWCCVNTCGFNISSFERCPIPSKRKERIEPTPVTNEPVIPHTV